MSLSLRQIRYFVAAADAGQISKAAMELNVSQSAVTAAVKSLEGQLDARLFDRHAVGVRLTYEGHQFLQRARNVLAAVNEAARITATRRDAIEGSLKVAMTYTVAGYFLPPHLARFQRNFPKIALALFERPRTEIEAGLLSGEFDLAMMLTSNLANRAAIDAQTLLRSRRRLWLASDHPLLEKAAVTLADVAAEPYVMLTVDEAEKTAGNYWQATPWRPRVIFRTSSVEAVRSMVSNGTGVTLLSDMVYRPWSLEGERIEAVTLTDPVPSMDVGIAWARQRPLSAAATAMVDHFRQSFGEAPA
jgi:DNA-binding transcriptional LysR family regulator